MGEADRSKSFGRNPIVDRAWLGQQAAAKLGEKVMARKTKRMTVEEMRQHNRSDRHDYGMEGDGKDLFITMDGKRVAQRGYPGTKYAGKWISIEPGIVVRDVPGEGAIEVEVNGVRVH